MTALEEIKKAFPNMFRPLKWHHFDGPTEHGCGEWYAHATRGMYHIYDVREKFPNDRPFYAKELSEQFDTLEQAKEAVQNRHEMDIVMCLDPDFRSTLESLQRENEEKSAWIKSATIEITKAIGGGSEMFTPHGDEFRVDPAFVSSFIQNRRDRHAESKKASIQKERELLARAEAAEAEMKRLRENQLAWRPMDSAPKDGKHCILSIPSGGFAYTVQGAFMGGKWINALNIDAEPLAWMPNVMLPDAYCPWKRPFSVPLASTKGDPLKAFDSLVEGPSFTEIASTGGEHHAE